MCCNTSVNFLTRFVTHHCLVDEANAAHPHAPVLKSHELLVLEVSHELATLLLHHLHHPSNLAP